MTAIWHVLTLRIANMASIYTQYAVAESRQGTVLLLQNLDSGNNYSRNRHDMGYFWNDLSNSKCTVVLWGRGEGTGVMIPLGIPKCKWEDMVKLYLKAKGCKGLD